MTYATVPIIIVIIIRLVAAATTTTEYDDAISHMHTTLIDGERQTHTTTVKVAGVLPVSRIAGAAGPMTTVTMVVVAAASTIAGGTADFGRTRARQVPPPRR